MKTKRSAAKILFLIFLSLLLIITIILSSCNLNGTENERISATLNDYENKILILENELAHIKDDQLKLENERNAELDNLKNELANLKKQIETAKVGSTIDEEEKKSDFTYRIESGEAIITGYTGSNTALIIPSMIDGYTVSSIDDEAFKGTKITSVSISATVKSIGWFAFSDCISLTAVVIPDSVVSIGYEAFSGAKNLTVYASSESYAAKYAKSYGIPLSLE